MSFRSVYKKGSGAIDSSWLIQEFGAGVSYEKSSKFIEAVSKNICSEAGGFANRAIDSGADMVCIYEGGLREILEAIGALRRENVNRSDINILKTMNIVLTHRIGVVQNSSYRICSVLFGEIHKSIVLRDSLSAFERGVFGSSRKFEVNTYESRLHGTDLLEDLSCVCWSFSLFPCTRLETVVAISIALNSMISSMESRCEGRESSREVFLGDIIERSMEHLQLGDSLRGGSASAIERFRFGCEIGLLIVRMIIDSLKRSSEEITVDKFTQICQKKAPQALFKHSSLSIGGRDLRDWFSDEEFRGRDFLEFLVSSNYIDRFDQAESRLIKSMEFGGPMYGIFTDGEKDIFLSSIKLYLDNRVEGNRAELYSPIYSARKYCFGLQFEENGGRDSLVCSAKEIYHIACNIEEYPDQIRYVEEYLSTILTEYEEKKDLHKMLGAPALERLSLALDRRPSNESEFLTAIFHINELDREESSTHSIVYSFDELRDRIVAAAPVILIDGGWLQYVLGPKNVHDESVRCLFRIMSEEMGEGNIFQNHVYIYRNLLDEFGVKLPEIWERSFVDYEEFTDDTFVLPSIILSLSLCSGRFFPEFMGMNLAIEISGLGTHYDTLIKNLDFHGVDSTFYRLHTTIDNFATGHSRISADLITSHLFRVSQYLTKSEMVVMWHRVWNGFKLLRFIYADLVSKSA